MKAPNACEKIWDSQDQFLSTALSSAREFCEFCFENVDRVDVILFGFPVEDSNADLIVSSSQEELNTSQFSNLPDQIEFYKQADPEAGTTATSSQHQAHVDNLIRSRSEEKAVVEALQGIYHNHEVFFRGDVRILNHRVAFALILDYENEQSTYRLPTIHNDETESTPASFLDAIADTLLESFIKEIAIADPRDSVATCAIDDKESLLKKAGKRFLKAPILATGALHGLHGLDSALSTIVSLLYEGNPATGGLLIAEESHPNIEHILSLSAPIELSNSRAIRKLIELTTDDSCLISDGHEVFGLGRLIGDYDQARSDLFEVSFHTGQIWELKHAGQNLVRFQYGVPSFPRLLLNSSKLHKDLAKVFPQLQASERSRIVDLALAASESPHGTTLVFTDDAEREVLRLEPQSIPVKAERMTTDLIRSITAIDGAVILNSKCYCFGIGAILDGQATGVGDPSRGARFNSARRYVESKKNSLALIVSEDGYSEWISSEIVNRS